MIQNRCFCWDKILFLHERIGSSNPGFLYYTRITYFQMTYLLNDKKTSKIYLRENSCFSPLLLFLFFFFFGLSTRYGSTNKLRVPYGRRFPSSRIHYLRGSERYVAPRSWCWAGSRGYSGENDRGQYRISLAGILWKFVRTILSIQWLVVSIRSRSRHLCPTSLPPSSQ